MNGRVDHILKKHSLRSTDIRRKVVSLFLQNAHAVTSHDIEYGLDKADRITIYRTLKTFEDKGIIHKVIGPDGNSKFALCEDNCDEHHHHDQHVHFHCDECGHTYCVEEATVPYIKLPSRYTVNQTDVILRGKCEKC